MKYIKYFFQFILIITCFVIFKILGPKISSNLGGKIFEKIGPLFRSKKIIHSNMKNAIPKIDNEYLNKLTNLMWNNYGRIFAEYIFIKDFRQGKLSSNIKIDGHEILDEIIKKKNKLYLYQVTWEILNLWLCIWKKLELNFQQFIVH